MASSSIGSTATSLEHFGHKVYSTVGQKGGQNIFLSPASIALAMSMCAVGARQETLEQMLRVLEVPSIEQLTKTAEQVMQVFSIAGQDNQVKLKLANRLYAQQAYKLREEYLSLVQKSFQADIQLEDFVAKGAAAVAKINTWVEDQTNNLIKNLLSPDDVSPDTRLILVNCIYFKGTWIKQFKEHATNENADFHEADGKISKVKLMFQKEKHSYAENKDLKVQVAHLPYKSDNHEVQFVFTVILPNRGVSLNEVEQTLEKDPNLLQSVLSHEKTRSQELLLHIPKFKMEATFQLNDVLKRLGMTNAFDDNKADFTGIVSPQDDINGLYISKVIHKAFIDVNELGSEAAAATAVVMASKSLSIQRKPEPIEFRADRSEAAAATAVIMTRCCTSIAPKPDPIEFKADRPFLFFIRENRQNIVLFSGRFMAPPQSA